MACIDCDDWDAWYLCSSCGGELCGSCRHECATCGRSFCEICREDHGHGKRGEQEDDPMDEYDEPLGAVPEAEDADDSAGMEDEESTDD